MALADVVQLVWRPCRKAVCEAVRPPVEGGGEGDAAQSVPSKPHAALLHVTDAWSVAEGIQWPRTKIREKKWVFV